MGVIFALSAVQRINLISDVDENFEGTTQALDPCVLFLLSEGHH